MFDNWEKYKEIVYPINPHVKKRETKYIIVCLNCENKREVCYAQAWNIIKDNCSGRCQSCAELNKDKSQFIKKEKKHKPKLKDVLKYRNLFDNPAQKNEVKEKLRVAKLGKTGENTPNWRGGTTNERKVLMSRDEYKQLRKTVFYRDNYKCVICASNENIQMDHIKEWCNYPELRYEVSNCRTLCLSCHKKTDNFASKALKKKDANGPDSL
jgi:hypothetical protein